MTDDIQTVREALRVDIFNRAEIEERRAAREALDRVEAVVKAAREVRDAGYLTDWSILEDAMRRLGEALAALDPTEAPA